MEAMILIRRGTAGDIPALNEIINYYIRETTYNYSTQEQSLFETARWFNTVSAGEYDLFVLEIEGKVVGYASYGPFRSKTGYAPTVEHSVYLLPGYEGYGYGRALLTAIMNAAREKGEAPLLVVCDEISDPHNLGAIIRTAYCAGAHGVIIPKRRSAGLTSIVAKTSAGAVSYLPVARVPNLPALLKDLKDQGVWVFGTAAGGTTDLYHADLKGPAAIVIGSEGEGMSRLVEENCDFLVSIPMKGGLNSLNASAAAAILLYEAVRQRMG